MCMLVFLVSVVLNANAVKDFIVSPTGVISANVVGSGSGSGELTITNVGDENVTINIADTNLIRGSDTITLTTNVSTIANLAPSGTTKVRYSYTAGSVLGEYLGNITFTEASNSNVNKTSQLSVTVTGTGGADMEIIGYDNSISFYGKTNQRLTKNLRFKNIGSIKLTNISIQVSDLDGVRSSDEIEKEDIDFDPDSNFELDLNERKNVEIEIDIPSSIARDTYEGMIYVYTDQGTFRWYLSVDIEGNEDDVVIKENSGDIRSSLLNIIGEAGKTLKNYEIVVYNQGDFDVYDLKLEVDSDLEEEYSSATIPKSAISFSPSILDLERRDSEVINVRIEIPKGQETGVYFSDINLVNSKGEEMDSVRLKLEVTGDVYIEDIKYPDTLNPGESMDLQITVRNRGSKTLRSVKLSASIFGIDVGKGDIHETSSSFILDVGQSRTETLRFSIPDEARDGSHTLEIRLNYDTTEVLRLREVTVERPASRLELVSSAVNPQVLKCDSQIYTYVKYQNLGKYEKNVYVTSEIIGTNIRATSNNAKVSVDGYGQESLTLDVRSLEPGKYTLVQKINYDGTFTKRETEIIIRECVEGSTGVDIKPINETNITDTSSVGKINIFGYNMDKTTTYLSLGLGSMVFVILLVGIFLL